MKATPIFKISILGNKNVGKTSLASKYVDGKFPSEYSPTFITNFVIKNMNCMGQNCKLCIWDNSGSHANLGTVQSCCDDANAVIFVYSVDDRQSFLDLDFWFQESLKLAVEDAVKIIVCCKYDLESEETLHKDLVSTDEAREFANSKDCELLFCSNIIGHDVENVFMTVTEKLLGEKPKSRTANCLTRPLKCVLPTKSCLFKPFAMILKRRTASLSSNKKQQNEKLKSSSEMN